MNSPPGCLVAFLLPGGQFPISGTVEFLGTSCRTSFARLWDLREATTAGKRRLRASDIMVQVDAIGMVGAEAMAKVGDWTPEEKAEAAKEIKEERRLKLERQRRTGFLLLGLGICMAVDPSAMGRRRSPRPSANDASRASPSPGASSRASPVATASRRDAGPALGRRRRAPGSRRGRAAPGVRAVRAARRRPRGRRARARGRGALDGSAGRCFVARRSARGARGRARGRRRRRPARRGGARCPPRRRGGACRRSAVRWWPTATRRSRSGTRPSARPGR